MATREEGDREGVYNQCCRAADVLLLCSGMCDSAATTKGLAVPGYVGPSSAYTLSELHV